MAISPDHPELQFVQAKSYAKGRTGPPLWIVVHDMEAGESGTRAESTAQYFATLPDGRSVSSHYCLAPETRILFADLTWRPIGEAEPGDRLVGFDEFPIGPGNTRKLQPSYVNKVQRRMADCLAVELEDGRRVVCSVDHRWLGRLARSTAGWRTGQTWIAAEVLSVGDKVKAPLRPWSTEDTHRAGYLAGILDGEGSFTHDDAISFAQKSGPVLDSAKQLLAEAGIPFTITDARERTGVVVVRVSGLDANLRLSGSTRPVRLSGDRLWLGKEMKSRLHETDLRVVAIERVGLREVVSIETSTSTFFAEGIASHNCVDDNSVVQCVALRDTAHTTGDNPGNPRGINWELAGFARQTRAEWLDAFGLAMFAQMASIVRADAARFGIPLERRTIAELKAFKPGITSHDDIGEAFGGTTHTDPGPAFPWDEFLEIMRGGDDMPDVSYQIESADPDHHGDVYVSNRIHRRGPLRNPGNIQGPATAGTTRVTLTDKMRGAESWPAYLDAVAGPYFPAFPAAPVGEHTHDVGPAKPAGE
jgi:hypothetical protein